MLTKTFEKDTTPKPKTIKNLFQKRSEKELRRTVAKSHLTPTMTIKNFTVVRKLGKGRFGNVYFAQYLFWLCRDKVTHAVVALKTISKRVILDNNMVGQLAQEIKIQTFLSHPNLLRMYGFFSDH
jgi:serine/threonine protein kinase